jgi:uncharacterized protein (TIGR03435 family)
MIRQQPGGMAYKGQNMSLVNMMTVAYQVTERQISGGPGWMRSDAFDVDAKAARPRTRDELHMMLRHLLEERFHMAVRIETRQQAVWELVVDKGGSKMPVHDPEDLDTPPLTGQTVRGKDGSVCPGLLGRNVTMTLFAMALSRALDRYVIDKTSLPVKYDVNLQFVPDGAPFRPEDITPGCSDIFAALPKQLGLRLESGKGPVEYVIVERAERPGEN